MTKQQLEKAQTELGVKGWEEVDALLEAEVVFTMGDKTLTLPFNEAVSMKNELDRHKKQIESELKELGENLKLAMLGAEQQKVRLWDGMTFEVREGRSPSKLEPTKLLEQGVSIEQIQAATVDGTPYQYVLINRPKEKK